MNSSELKGYLTGLIVGDGYIDKGITKRAFYIKNTCYEFIHKILTDLSSCTNFHISVQEKNGYVGADGTLHQRSWCLYIKAHPYFAKKYHHFYNDDRRRRVSADATKWLTPMGIANWYMSDGYVCLVGKNKGKITHRRIEFATDRYDIGTINRLIKFLFDKFDIKASAIKHGKYYRIRINACSYSNFINLIRPYIVDTMTYKLYLGYDYQPKWMSDEMWQDQQNLRSAITLTGSNATEE